MNDFPCDALRTYVCEIFDPQIFYAGSRGTKLSAESGLFGAKAVSTSSDDSPDSASPQSNSASSSSDEGANFIDFDPSSNTNSNPTASAISDANKNLLVLCLVVFNIGTILGCISCLFWSKRSRMTSAKVIYDGVHYFYKERLRLLILISIRMSVCISTVDVLNLYILYFGTQCVLYCLFFVLFLCPVVCKFNIIKLYYLCVL